MKTKNIYLEKKKNNDILNNSKINGFDEYYTLYENVESEVSIYKKLLKNKIILCPCDDENSNFYKFFYNNLIFFDIKKVIFTHLEQDENKQSYKITLNNNNGEIEVLKSNLKGNGDFTSEEIQQYWQEADWVITNPPFSIWKKFWRLLLLHKVYYLVIFSNLFLCYREVWKEFKKGNIFTSLNKEALRFFYNPKFKVYRSVNCVWYTNYMPWKKAIMNHKEKVYTINKDINEYQKFYNLDILEVNQINNLPANYDGIMAVSIAYPMKNFSDYELVGIDFDYDFKYELPQYAHKFNIKTNKLEKTLLKRNSFYVGQDSIPKNKSYFRFPNDPKFYLQVFRRFFIRKKKNV